MDIQAIISFDCHKIVIFMWQIVNIKKVFWRRFNYN